MGLPGGPSESPGRGPLRGGRAPSQGPHRPIRVPAGSPRLQALRLHAHSTQALDLQSHGTLSCAQAQALGPQRLTVPGDQVLLAVREEVPRLARVARFPAAKKGVVRNLTCAMDGSRAPAAPPTAGPCGVPRNARALFAQLTSSKLGRTALGSHPLPQTPGVSAPAPMARFGWSRAAGAGRPAGSHAPQPQPLAPGPRRARQCAGRTAHPGSAVPPPHSNSKHQLTPFSLKADCERGGSTASAADLYVEWIRCLRLDMSLTPPGATSVPGSGPTKQN